MRIDIKYSKNKGLVISPFELINSYLFGVEPSTRDGRRMPDQSISDFIQFAQNEIENKLDIRLQKKVIHDNHTFFRNDFVAWGIVRTNYPVVEAFGLEGFYNNTRQLSYPKTWISSRKSSEQDYERRINIVPDNTLNSPMLHTQIAPFYGLYRSDFLPEYWMVTYVTGYDKIPRDILNVIGKLASINILRICGDVMLGIGVASMSVGIDGLSQSITKPQGSIFADRIKGYMEEIKDVWPSLISKYKGLSIISA